MSLNGIAGSAISALKTNSAALTVVANNVSNLNTPGYARRVVNQQTLAANGQLMGVDIASIQRITSQFFAQEQLSAGAAASQYDTMADLFDQLNGVLGGPGDNQSLATGLTNLASAFATASQAPTSSASRTGVMNALNGLASDFANVGRTISSMRGQIDQQVVNSISSTNTLIKQIYDLNTQIRNASRRRQEFRPARSARCGADQSGPGDGHQDHGQCRWQRHRLHRRWRQSGIQHLCPAFL